MGVEDGEPKPKDLHQEPVYKHFCRVCKRGFGCAGALGGHMRSHGSISDARWSSNRNGDDDDEEEFAIAHSLKRNHDQNTKHSYFLRTNAGRFTSYRGSDHDHEQDFHVDGVHRQKNHSPSKSEVEEAGQQNRRYTISEEEDLANCLVMLSNNSFIPSRSRDHHREENKANNMNPINQEEIKGNNLFQCKACKKVFNSHQALGGHRASHKKVKGCYASKSTTDHHHDDPTTTMAEELFSATKSQSENSSAGVLDVDHNQHYQINVGKSNSKSHQCSICHRIFSSGQALGGHKRCHWLTTNLPADNTIIQNLQDFTFDYNNNNNHHLAPPPPPLPPSTAASLDLNFPPFLNQNATAHDVNLFLRLWGNGNGNVTARDSMAARESENGNQDDDDDCRRKKMAKLSDLRDVPDGESSSRWLQMGIASTTP